MSPVSSGPLSFDWDESRAEQHRSEGVHALIWVPRPTLVVTRLTGRAELGSFRFYAALAERQMRHGKLTVFHDWSRMKGDEPEARSALRRWAIEHNSHFGDVHYLVPSKVTAMLISVAALMLGRPLHGHTDRSVFLEKLGQALAGTEGT